MTNKSRHESEKKLATKNAIVSIICFDGMIVGCGM
jgi:hypothetical protein